MVGGFTMEGCEEEKKLKRNLEKVEFARVD
jgi:hypothetical protein